MPAAAPALLSSPASAGTFAFEHQIFDRPLTEALLSSPLTQGLAAARADQLHVVDGTVTVGAAWGRMDAFWTSSNASSSTSSPTH